MGRSFLSGRLLDRAASYVAELTIEAGGLVVRER